MARSPCHTCRGEPAEYYAGVIANRCVPAIRAGVNCDYTWGEVEEVISPCHKCRGEPYLAALEIILQEVPAIRAGVNRPIVDSTGSSSSPFLPYVQG